MIKNYIPNEYKKSFPNKNAPNVGLDDVEYVKNGTICIDKQNCSGVVYDERGQLCDASITYRFDGCVRIPRLTPPCSRITRNCDFINETVVFMGCGYIFSHFGHFLLEGLARAYPALDKKYQKFVFVVNRGTKSLPSFVMTMLGALGIKPENIILISKNTRFAGVYVPPQGSVITKYISPIMTDVFDTIGKKLGIRGLKTYDKIYLSRSKMNDGRTFGEKQIENIFAKNGYKIIWPETLSVPEQITLVKNCKILAGTAGTALHLSLFMKPGATVVQIKRNTMPDDNAEIQNDICNFRKLNFTYIAGGIETTATPHFTQIPQIIGVTKYMQKFFDDNNFKYSKSDITPNTAEFAKYTKQLRKYRAHKNYARVVKLFARIVSVFGITKYGRQIIREYITRTLHAN